MEASEGSFWLDNTLQLFRQRIAAPQAMYCRPSGNVLPSVMRFISTIQAMYCRPSGIVFIQDILQGIHGSLLAHTDDFRHIPEKVI